MTKLDKLLKAGAVSAAKNLIGWRLYKVEQDGTHTGGVITETEAYTQADAASHSYKGKTPHTEIMFGEYGYVYTYFTYGMHWCMNIVTGQAGHGEAVLIRAIFPDSGINHMRLRRSNKADNLLTNGPAKVCQALNVGKKDNGTKLNDSNIVLLPPQHTWHVTTTKRIGITKDTHRLWRFVGNLN
jgi:DNA-3-methyladenine glycosylase